MRLDHIYYMGHVIQMLPSRGVFVYDRSDHSKAGIGKRFRTIFKAMNWIDEKGEKEKGVD